MRSTPFGDREEVKLVYFTDQLDAKKQPIQVVQTAARSLDERSNLFAILNGILGGNMPDDGLDPEKLIGTQVILDVEIVSGKRGAYAKVLSVTPGADGQSVRVPAAFKRAVRRSA
jgi:hypothetical protein